MRPISTLSSGFYTMRYRTWKEKERKSKFRAQNGQGDRPKALRTMLYYLTQDKKDSRLGLSFKVEALLGKKPWFDDG
jgi:hypothetical protein